MPPIVSPEQQYRRSWRRSQRRPRRAGGSRIGASFDLPFARRDDGPDLAESSGWHRHTWMRWHGGTRRRRPQHPCLPAIEGRLLRSQSGASPCAALIVDAPAVASAMRRPALWRRASQGAVSVQCRCRPRPDLFVVAAQLFSYAELLRWAFPGVQDLRRTLMRIAADLSAALRSASTCQGRSVRRWRARRCCRDRQRRHRSATSLPQNIEPPLDEPPGRPPATAGRPARMTKVREDQRVASPWNGAPATRGRRHTASRRPATPHHA